MTTHIVESLEQARLLTDAFKLRLLEQFAEAPRTTKQVADILGEKPPRLYRHVEALAHAGLLELVEERPNRGTIERYYRTIASRFEIAPTLFAAGEADGEQRNWVNRVFREAGREVHHALEALGRTGVGDGAPDEAVEPLVLKASLRATPQQVLRLRQKLVDWIAECESTDPDDAERSAPPAPTIRMTGLVAFFPSPPRNVLGSRRRKP